MDVTKGPKSRAFADWLLQELDARDMSRRALARSIGVHASTVHYWISGRSVPGTENIYPLAQALNVDADWLLALTEHRPLPGSRLNLEDPLVLRMAAVVDDLSEEDKRWVMDTVERLRRKRDEG